MYHRALNYIGIARKGGAVEIGEERAHALVKSGAARLMVVTSDSSPGAKRRAEGYVFGTATPLAEVPFTKQEISEIAGKAGCSMLAFRDLGLASGFADALAAEYGESYQELSDTLRAKQEKLGRKKGKRRKSE
ncbi:MAG: 50S ribosomal protein L7 [Oscillospiraceae bacterium]|nr:50S ribosomal protein L7 [Oscillospiraceae bacterium]